MSVRTYIEDYGWVYRTDIASGLEGSINLEFEESGAYGGKDRFRFRLSEADARELVDQIMNKLEM